MITMEEGDGKIELIPRTHIISGSLVMSQNGQRYYVGPFDGNRVKSVVLVPFLNQSFHDLGGLFAILDFSRVKNIPVEEFLEDFLVIFNEEGTTYPN